MGAAGFRFRLEDPPALEDFAQAVKHVREQHQRRHAGAGSVGAIGFSAGAHLIQALSRAAAPVRLDHAAFLYGPMRASPGEGRHPPSFVALAGDDPLFSRQGYGLVTALQERATPVELHVYERGGHGFGAAKQDAPSDRWIEDYMAWLSRR